MSVGESSEPVLYRELTVARVRGLENTDDIEVMFLESPQIFRLSRTERQFDELLERLREGDRVHVGLTAVDSEVIIDVRRD